MSTSHNAKNGIGTDGRRDHDCMVWATVEEKLDAAVS